MYLMQTVSTGPSRSYPNPKHFDEITVMNSTEELSKYSDGNSHYRSPTLARRTGDENEIPNNEKTTKKEKKWSLGHLFRRRKKDIETESSSEDDTPPKRGFLQRRRSKKEDKKKKRPKGTFDHVVVAPTLYTNGVSHEQLNSPETVQPPRPTLPKCTSLGSNEIITRSSRESLIKNRSELNASYGSLQSSIDSTGKKTRRIKVKARVEAMRDKLKNDSSSDEGSQKSNASSNTRFKSDESLPKSQNGSLSRRSRAARTERYIKRLTKEEENVLNKEAERMTSPENKTLTQNRWVVVDNVDPPLKQFNKPNLYYSPSAPQKPIGTSTVPPSHIIHRANSTLSDSQRINYTNNNNVYQNVRRTPLRNDHLSEQRSFSYDCNINRSPTPVHEGEVLHVQFPIGKPVPKPRNPNLINNYSSNNSLQRTTPPPPPPRDPHRRIYYQYENNRPMSYAFENGNNNNNNNNQQRPSGQVKTPQNINRTSSFGWQPNYRSNSEDHIAQANQYINLQTRPASATPDMPQQRFIRRHPRMDQYHYFAEKTPRSRKPIIAAVNQPDQPYLSDSQMLARATSTVKPNSASEFWRQKDLEESRRKSQLIDNQPKRKPIQDNRNKNFTIISIPVKQEYPTSNNISPMYPKQVFEQNPETVHPRVERIQVAKKEITPPPPPPVRSTSRHSSGSSVENNWTQEEEFERKRRSTNLEEALDELEAIYKSLRLGDEDLLDRAERRDVPVAAQKRLSQWNHSGTQSDSGFGFDFVDSPRKQKSLKRIPDKINDDMAYRRLCKDKIIPSDPQVPPVSYLLASPLMDNLPDSPTDNFLNKDEPDVILDDVVYRNLKHANSQLKVVEPQPAFGIPLGPITAAPNSDYLHAVPETHSRSRFVPQKSPDIVKDDLAYRSLRKDNMKDPSLPPLGPDDYINNNNNHTKETENVGRVKKRAVRSMSANVFNLMHQDENEFDRTSSLTDIADAMEIAHKILREHNSKIFSKMNFSDTETRKETKPVINFNYAPTSTETLTESKSNLLNDVNENKLRVYLGGDELNQKPPRCPTPDRRSKSATKESTPNRVSSPVDTSLDKSQLEELLTALAIEARETSEKLDKDLRLLDEESSRRCTPRISGRSTPDMKLTVREANEKLDILLDEERKLKEENAGKNEVKQIVNDKSNRNGSVMTTDDKLKDIDAVSEHAKLCEKLLECVVESTELIAPKIPEVTESKEAELMEEVNELPNETTIYKSVANIIVTRKADLPIPADPRPELESDHDYDNISNGKSKMDYDNLVERKSGLSTLKESSDSESNDSITGELCHFTNLETFHSRPGACKEGEVCRINDCVASNSQECSLILQPPVFDELLTCNNTNENEHSSGFHTESNSSSPNFQINYNNEITFENSPQSEFSSISSTDEVDSKIMEFNSIKSFSDSDVQKLEDDYVEAINVSLIESQEMSTDQENNFDGCFNRENVPVAQDSSSSDKEESLVDESNNNVEKESKLGVAESLLKPSTSFYISESSLESSEDSEKPNAPSTSKQGTICVKTQNTDDKTAWYKNPTTIALACSYGIACAHQIALIDLVTLLGLLLAIVSVIAAFVL